MAAIYDPLISQAEVKGRFEYNPDTGVFIDRSSGKVAGQPNADGYLMVRLGGKTIGLHRVAFMWMYGHWPRDMVDHVNGITNDNRLINIRPATATLNAQNSWRYRDGAGEFKGVKRTKNGRYTASITVNGRKINIRGTFESAFAAHQAYKAMANRHFGAFARTEAVRSVPPSTHGPLTNETGSDERFARLKASAAANLGPVAGQ